jgi:predicted AlkP superfamily phosphohydrolase/phosphomutase
MGYKIDVDSDKARKSTDLFLKDLSDTLEARIGAFRYLWESEEWQTFMLVFTGTDRLAHFLWDAYEDESHKYHGAFLDHLHRIDEVVGDVVSRMNEGDSLVMLSDHGFELTRCEVNINRVLAEEGYLRFRNQPPQSLADVDEGTRAFALDPARIYVNLEGRYPRGSVKAEDRESAVNQLSDLFTALEVDGEKVVERICRREDIYEGPYASQGPDLVLVGNSGFDLKASLRATEIHRSSSFAGKHTQKDAFLLVNSGREGVLPESPRVHQVVDIIRELTGRKVYE